MKPIIKYRGGKSKEIPQILPYIPEFTGRYIEPFFGGGALFFYLEPHNAIINDINSNLITFYEDVKYNYTKIKEELSAIEIIYKKNRKDFDKIKALNPNDRVDDANEEKGTPGHLRIAEAEEMAEELFAYIENLPIEGWE